MAIDNVYGNGDFDFSSISEAAKTDKSIIDGKQAISKTFNTGGMAVTRNNFENIIVEELDLSEILKEVNNSNANVIIKGR